MNVNKERVTKAVEKITAFKIYDKVENISKDKANPYYEAHYTEYEKSGEGISLKSVGTEDFSKERLNSQTKLYDVYTYNGKVMHGCYREGWRMTDCAGNMRLSKNAPVKEAAETIYGKGNVSRTVRISGYSARKNKKERDE